MLGPPENMLPNSTVSVASTARTMRSANMAVGSDKLTAYEGREVLDQFKSKTLKVRQGKDKEGLPMACEWNERFILHVQGSLDEMRLVIAAGHNVSVTRVRITDLLEGSVIVVHKPEHQLPIAVLTFDQPRNQYAASYQQALQAVVG